MTSSLQKCSISYIMQSVTEAACWRTCGALRDLTWIPSKQRGMWRFSSSLNTKLKALQPETRNKCFPQTSQKLEDWDFITTTTLTSITIQCPNITIYLKWKRSQQLKSIFDCVILSNASTFYWIIYSDSYLRIKCWNTFWGHCMITVYLAEQWPALGWTWWLKGQHYKTMYNILHANCLW